MTVYVQIKSLHSNFKLPEKATKLSSGFDLRYCGNKHILFDTLGEMQCLDLGCSMQLPKGYEAQIRPRSGLAAKYGVSVVNTPGTIDADYTGPIKVFLVKTANTKKRDPNDPMSEYIELPELLIAPGDRICQMVIQKIPDVQLILTDQLSKTERSDGGFGSTGLK